MSKDQIEKLTKQRDEYAQGVKNLLKGIADIAKQRDDAEARLAEAVRALEDELRRLDEIGQYRTHVVGSECDHPSCIAARRIRATIAKLRSPAPSPGGAICDCCQLPIDGERHAGANGDNYCEACWASIDAPSPGGEAAKCGTCGGAGWVWGHEKSPPTEQPDDTRYSCPDCTTPPPGDGLEERAKAYWYNAPDEATSWDILAAFACQIRDEAVEKEAEKHRQLRDKSLEELDAHWRSKLSRSVPIETVEGWIAQCRGFANKAKANGNKLHAEIMEAFADGIADALKEYQQCNGSGGVGVGSEGTDGPHGQDSAPAAAPASDAYKEGYRDGNQPESVRALRFTSDRDYNLGRMDGIQAWESRNKPAPASDPAATGEKGAVLGLTLREVECAEQYVVYHGGIHDDSCPQDDTCDCSAKHMNDGINRVLRFARVYAAGRASKESAS